MDNFDLKKYIAEGRLLKENLRFTDLDTQNTYKANQDFSIFTKNEPVYIEKIIPMGNQARVYIKNSKGDIDDIIGDFNEEVEVLSLN